MCPQDIALKWHAEAGSGIYATPLITDLFSDGKKDIVVPAFQHHLEVRNGQVVCCAAVVEVAGARRCPPSSTTWRRVGCRVGTLFGCGWRWRRAVSDGSHFQRHLEGLHSGKRASSAALRRACTCTAHR